MLQSPAEINGTRRSAAKRLSSPSIVLAAAAVLLALLSAVKLKLPVGPFYWDLVLYLDAANRIADGQVPNVDFFAPVGPLGYWLFSLAVRLFPEGQPLLLVQWSLLLVTGPALALVLHDVDRRSRTVAFALLTPFLIFSLLPFNVEEYASFPGVDGFGIYNRQACHLLYVLTASLVFVRSQRVLFLVVAAAMTALFLVKITGFLAGVLLCTFAFAAGRVGWRAAGGAVLVFVAVLAALQGFYGLVSAYVGGIAALVAMNESSLLPRFLQAGSIHFVVVAPSGVLLLVLAILRFRRGASPGTPGEGRLPGGALRNVLDEDAVWLAVALLAALFFETQNTGGQAFIFVWPVLLRILIRSGDLRRGTLLLILSLVAASAIPSFMQVVQRAGRAFAGQLKYEALVQDNLKSLGQVTQRREIIERAGRMIDVYRRFPEPYEYLAGAGILPSLTLYSDIDFQVAWLKTVDEAVGAIGAYEAANGVRFETIMNLGFVNPFPWLMDRHAPRYIAIGADPGRSFPEPGSAVLAAVEAADLVLSPRCPITDADRKLREFYRPSLDGHDRISLSPCWDAFMRRGLASRP